MLIYYHVILRSYTLLMSHFGQIFKAMLLLLLYILVRYDDAVDVVPEVRWLSEDKYKNLKVVVEIDEAVDAEKAAEKELQRHHKTLG